MFWSPWKRRILFLATVAGIYWVILFALTHVPGSGRGGIGHLDKVVHFLAYFGLAFLLGLVVTLWQGYSARRLFCAWLLVAAYGILDELSQTLVPGRTCSINDWLADILGGGAGALVIAVVVRLKRPGADRSGPSRGTEGRPRNIPPR